VPREKILLVVNPRSTHGDALLSKKLCEKNNIRSLIVVSEPYHTRRAHYTFKRVYRGSGIKLTTYPAQASWWRTEEGIDVTYSEYVKLLYYLFLGRLV